MWTNYINARSVDEALSALATYRDRARIVAGATDLLIELERGARPGVDTLIDISRVEGASKIAFTPILSQVERAQGQIHLGPLVTHAEACSSSLLQQHALPLAQACWEVGAPQIRARATIAGNLITASPANDTIVPLMALDAMVTLRSAERGDRVVPLRNFYMGVRRTVIQPDELLVDISFRALGEGEVGIFDKLVLRQAQAISVVNVACIIRFAPHPNPRPAGELEINSACIALGCVAPTVVRCEDAEAYLAGKTLSEAVTHDASSLAQRAAKPIDDIRAPASYRLDMVKVITVRALRAIANGQVRGQLPVKPVLLGAGNPRPHSQVLPVGAEGIQCVINGKPFTFEHAHHKTLLRALREDAGLIGTKEGCAEGECGACTVFLDGAAVVSCLVPAPRASGATVDTIESLSQSDNLHPLQQAFVDAGAVQCGYCTPGFIMSGAKLLQERPSATQAEAQEAISGNLCRCTGYYKILEAFEKARQMMR